MSLNISVLIPTYNHAEYLRESVMSAIDQQVEGVEVIVVDDGSTDNTSEVFRSLAPIENVRCYRQLNEGMAAARNTAARVARGKYLKFVDDDDVLVPTCLSQQYSLLESNPDVVAAGGLCQEFGSDHSHVIHLPIGRIEDSKPFHRGFCFHTPGAVLLRADSFRLVGGYRTEVWGADDLDLWVRLVRLGALLVHDDVVLNYRVHPTNSSKQYWRLYQNALRVLEDDHQYHHGPSRPYVVHGSIKSFYANKAIAAWRKDKQCIHLIRYLQLLNAHSAHKKYEYVNARVRIWLGALKKRILTTLKN